VSVIRTFGGRNSFANALLILGDEFLRENRRNIERLPEKHKAEFFARLSEMSPQPQPDVENLSCVFGVIEPTVSETCVLIKKDTEWIGEEQTCRLTEDFQVSSTELKKVALTNPEKQNCAVVYDSGEDFHEFDFSACFEMEKGVFFLYFSCKNVLYSISRREFQFYADNLDSCVYADSNNARWFIQSGEETIPVNAKIVSPGKIALKADGDLDFIKEDDFTIGVEILNNAFLPYSNFTNPLFSFGMGDYLKPDLIIRNGEAREMPFYPFGYPLETQSDFFIACDEAFSMRGAKVTLQLDLRFEEFSQPYETVPEINKEKYCKADKTGFQYFNGERFVPLPESRIYDNLFFFF
jgi:hypothetical protein